MTRSNVPATSTHGRTALQRKAPIDRIVSALESHYWEQDATTAVAELQELDDVGLALLGKMLVHAATSGRHITRDWLLSSLIEIASDFAETAEGPDEDVVRFKAWYASDFYPRQKAMCLDTDARMVENPEEAETYRQKARDLRELAAVGTEGGAV